MSYASKAKYLSLAVYVFGAIFIVGIYVMLVQALKDSTETMNLYGDIPALFLVVIVLWRLMPGKAG